MKRAISILVMMVALLGAAQESQTIKLQFDQSKISPLFTMPELPTAISPATNIRPTFDAQFPNATELQLNERNTMADSLAVYQQGWKNDRLTALPHFRYDTDQGPVVPTLQHREK